MQDQRVSNKKENALIKIITNEPYSTWKRQIENTLNKYNISEDDIKDGKYRLKNRVHRENEIIFIEKSQKKQK